MNHPRYQRPLIRVYGTAKIMLTQNETPSVAYWIRNNSHADYFDEVIGTRMLTDESFLELFQKAGECVDATHLNEPIANLSLTVTFEEGDTANLHRDIDYDTAVHLMTYAQWYLFWTGIEEPSLD